MIRAAVCGACGRMGSRIVRALSEQDDMEVVAAIERPGAEEVGEDIGEVVGIEELGVEVTRSDKIGKTLRDSDPDILVDFTIAEAAVGNVIAAAEKGVSVVVGTTGFSEDQWAEIEEAVEESGIGAVISSNMSVGVNVFFNLIGEAAEMLEGYDMELVEAHHNKKVDAPSGTALEAARIAAEASGSTLEKVAKFGRPRGNVGERPEGEIGIHSIRAGNIVGDHKLIFAGPNDRLELVHRAQSRQAFADGAVRAVRHVIEAGEPGEIHDMQDVLF